MAIAQSLSVFSRLPIELQTMILDHLGRRYFVQDLRRLTISRQWYNIALPIVYRSLTITARDLADYSRANRRCKFRAPALDSLPGRQHVRELHLHCDFTADFLSSWGHETRGFEPQSLLREVEEKVNSSAEIAATEPWRLTSVLSPWPSLQQAHFCIYIHSDHDSSHILARTLDMMHHVTLHSGASIKLEIELSGGGGGLYVNPCDSCYCSQISRIIPYVDTLLYRGLRMCEDIFQPSLPTGRPLKLRELHLALSEMGPRLNCITRSKAGDINGQQDFGATMAAAATRWMRQAHEARSVDILWMDGYTPTRYDALTNTFTKYTEGRQWSNPQVQLGCLYGVRDDVGSICSYV